MRQNDENLSLAFLGQLSKERLMKHTREISQYVRLSGSEDESRALRYVRKQLEESGFEVREDSFESYVGFPKMASLTVVASKKKYGGTAPAISVLPTPRALRVRDLWMSAAESPTITWTRRER